MQKLSFVIPCYCSEKTITSVIEEIQKTVKNEQPYEIICINDNSSDGTIDVLKRKSQENKNVKILCFSKNFGQHSALLAGYRHVTGDIIVSLDDDGQTPPRECYKLIDMLSEKYDVVYADYASKKHSFFRNMGSMVNKIMLSYMLNLPRNISCNSYFAAKRFVIDEIVHYNKPFPYITGLILGVTRKIGNVQIDHQKRLYGKSGYTLKKLFSLWLNGFTAFSVKPLRLATLFGSFFSLVGFIFAFIIVIQKLINPGIAAGFTSIMTVILFISGVLMLMLGLLGEYVGRIYICINNPAQYVIKETFNIDEIEI